MIFELVHPASVEIEITLLPYLCCVGKDRTDAEGTTDETIEAIGCCASVVRELLNPTTDHANTEFGFEALDYDCFQV